MTARNETARARLWRLASPSCSASPWPCSSSRAAGSIGAVAAEFVAGTGGQGAGLAYQIVLAGLQLDIPRMFAALLLIAAAGVKLLAATVWLSRAALGRWHDSELGPRA